MEDSHGTVERQSRKIFGGKSSLEEVLRGFLPIETNRMANKKSYYFFSHLVFAAF